jgi:hypothetical protein
LCHGEEIMASKIKSMTVWRAEVDNKPGALAKLLEPLKGEDLAMVVGYHFRGEQKVAAVDLGPLSGRKARAAATAAGFKPIDVPMIAVEGANRRGVGSAIAEALGEAGINIEWLTAQVAGKKYAAVFGFHDAADAKKAARIIKKAATKKAVKGKAKHK